MICSLYSTVENDPPIFNLILFLTLNYKFKMVELLDRGISNTSEVEGWFDDDEQMIDTQILP